MEPTSSGTAGVIGWKLIGGLAGLGAIGAGLATLVVICVTRPRESREWVVAIVSTVMCSIGGGAAVISHYRLQHWANDFFGLVAMLGLVFACGLPGWALVRWIFKAINKREGQDIVQIIQEIQAIKKGGEV